MQRLVGHQKQTRGECLRFAVPAPLETVDSAATGWAVARFLLIWIVRAVWPA